MRYEQQGSLEISDPVGQPDDGIKVEVVRWFVE